METYAQHSIKHCLDMIAPFEASDENRKEGQAQFYEFMISIYKGMYEKPEEYLVFPMPYEEYIIKREQKNSQKIKEREHISDSRESTLRNTFQQAIQFYALYFYNLGLKCEGIDEQSGSLLIFKEEYASVQEQMNRLHGSEYNAERYQILTGLGIQVYENREMVQVGHKRFKRLMEGALYLCKAPDSKYKWTNFLRMDYKNAYAPIPTVDDICKTLPPESVYAVKKLEEQLAGIKIKAKIRPLRGIVSDFKWKVEYSYKSKNICGFYADNEYFMLCIYFNRAENISEFSKILQKEDSELFLWFRNQFPERLCKCRNNRRVFFGDEPRRICGLSNRAEIVNPNDKDIEKALYILRKYRDLNR